MNKIYKFFGNDSLFGRIFGTLGNIIIVNFFFILCSIPVITFGASFTSMYYALLRSLKYGDTSLTRDFFRSFRENFRQSTLSWIISVVFIIVFSADIGMFGPNGVYPVTAVYYLIIVLAVIVAITAMFVFPVIAAFRNTLKKLWIQSFFLAAKNLPSALIILVLNVVPLYMSLTTSSPQIFGTAMFVWITAGFGLTAWINSFLFYRIFTPYLASDEEPESCD
jgi:Predicted integral membrane protein